MSDVNVECTIEDDLQLSSDGLEAMGAGVSNWPVSDVRILVTRNVQGAVRRLVPALSQYRTERGMGRVAARVVTEVDPPVIVVDGQLLVDAETTAVERLLAHETGHLVLRERGEDFTDELAGGRHPADWRRWIEAWSAIAVEEFRIESAVFEWGYGASPWRDIQHTSDVLYDLNWTLPEILLDPQSQDVEFMAGAVCAVASDLSKHFAYAAAWIGEEFDWHFPVEQLSQAGQADWTDYVGEAHWHERAGLYARIPTAAEVVDKLELRDLIVEAGALEAGLLRRLGFYFEGEVNDRGSGDWGFWRVQGDEVWERRIERGHIDARARGELD